MIQKILFRILIVQVLAGSACFAQETSYGTEPLISPLPEALVSIDGLTINQPKQWSEFRRKEILDLFGDYVYGKVPSVPLDISFNLKLFDKNAMEGSAVQKEVDVSVSNG
ncbi:MAG: hypothetical protein KAT15_05565, partial [Bacteroidales bacterium]|nr:hypothetical protein [Bacteroidales bacterium]